MHIKNQKIAAVISHADHFLKKNYRDNIPALAGQSAFFLILSAVPALMFTISVISMLTGMDINSLDIPQIDHNAYPYIEPILRFVEESFRSSGSGTAVITALVILWSAGKGMYYITDGIARVYGVPDRRLWLFKRVFAMGYTLLMMLIFLIDLLILIANNVFIAVISSWIGGMSVVSWLLNMLLYLIFCFIQAAMMSLGMKIYLSGKIKNKRYCSMRALMPGMLLTVIAWNIMTFGMIFYIRHFAASSIYGSLSSLFMLMIWVYFLMYILLCGVQLDFIYREQFCSFSFSRLRRGQEKPGNT